MTTTTRKPAEVETLERVLALRRRRVLHSLPGRRDAAVLVPIVGVEAVLHVLFTLRTDSVPTHKGQVAFPGGGCEDDDRDVVDTALREAEEEIGLRRKEVQILGLGDDAFSITGLKVTPVIGYVAGLPPLRLSEREIAEVFTVPVVDLKAPDAHFEQEFEGPSGEKRRVPFFRQGPHPIWGLTAWILREVLGAWDGGPGYEPGPPIFVP